jgi:hypothetical protein
VDRRRLFLRLFAYAVQVHRTKYLIEIGFPLLVIELGVAAMGRRPAAGSIASPIPASQAPADGLLVRCSGSPTTPS